MTSFNLWPSEHVSQNSLNIREKLLRPVNSSQFTLLKSDGLNISLSLLSCCWWRDEPAGCLPVCLSDWLARLPFVRSKPNTSQLSLVNQVSGGFSVDITAREHIAPQRWTPPICFTFWPPQLGPSDSPTPEPLTRIRKLVAGELTVRPPSLPPG